MLTAMNEYRAHFRNFCDSRQCCDFACVFVWTGNGNLQNAAPPVASERQQNGFGLPTG